VPNWQEIAVEVERIRANAEHSRENALSSIRREYLRKLHALTGRNVIAYYSGFLSKRDADGLEINHEDTNAFMVTIHQLDRSRGLDLVLHTPGGGVSAAISIVSYLRAMFGRDIRVIVPQIAMSAGTMIACSARVIWMAKHSQLGPTDPQLRGVAAAGVKQEFERACAEVKADPSRIAIWQAIIGRYAPTFLSQCEQAVDLTRDFVREQLRLGMFANDVHGAERAQAIAARLTDFSHNKAHDVPLHIEECQRIGLSIERIEDDPAAQELVLSAHHCFMHAFMNGPTIKIVENHRGTAVVKQLAPYARRA
jgi:ATP-dependent protease ClpP protease subunit